MCTIAGAIYVGSAPRAASTHQLYDQSLSPPRFSRENPQFIEKLRPTHTLVYSSWFKSFFVAMCCKRGRVWTFTAKKSPFFLLESMVGAANGNLDVSNASLQHFFLFLDLLLSQILAYTPLCTMCDRARCSKCGNVHLKRLSCRLLHPPEGSPKTWAKKRFKTRKLEYCWHSIFEKKMKKLCALMCVHVRICAHVPK